MSWILLAILVFIFSTALYLVLRKLGILDVKDEIQNLFLFLPATIILFIFSKYKGFELWLNPSEVALVFVAAVFIWIGNTFMLKSLKLAPNPGYTVLIGKSYVLITVLLSPILFGSVLTFKSILLVLGILFFVSFIIIDKKGNKKTSSRGWVLPAFLAFAFWGIMSLSLIALNRPTLTPEVVTMYMSLIASVLIGFEIKFKKTDLRLSGNKIIWLLVLGLIGLFFNIFIITGYRVAPNPGFMDAVNASSVAAIAILSSLIFKDELTPKKLAGIAGVLVCLVLLLL